LTGLGPVVRMPYGDVRNAAPVEFVVERAGSSIHVWLSGSAEGPLIVLSHRASMDHRMFDPNPGRWHMPATR